MSALISPTRLIALVNPTRQRGSDGVRRFIACESVYTTGRNAAVKFVSSETFVGEID